MSQQISCGESDHVKRGLRVLSGLTNFVGGVVLDPSKPAHTARTWGLEDGTEVLREIHDADGCRHYYLGWAEIGDAT